MRVCIVGGGLAGTLLAWRLAQHSDVEQVDLLLGRHRSGDATAVSAGVIRGYEPHPDQRRLAIDSLIELRESPVLRQWSAYHEGGSVYLRASGPDVITAVQDIEAPIPGSVELATDGQLADRGWRGLPDGTVGVVERRAGYISPPRLRLALIADLIARPAVTVSEAILDALTLCRDGTLGCTVARRCQHYDRVVLAAGAWTPTLLARDGFEDQGLRTKSIQYAVYPVRGVAPPPFVDETSGLYGRPTNNGALLLGLATQIWDVPPGTSPVNADFQRYAARLAILRRGELSLLSPIKVINASDCYCDPPTLSLRPVAGSNGAVHTFTGGSGGAVKAALAASRQAVSQFDQARPRHSSDNPPPTVKAKKP